jgi:hypothetical protein
VNKNITRDNSCKQTFSHTVCSLKRESHAVEFYSTNSHHKKYGSSKKGSQESCKEGCEESSQESCKEGCEESSQEGRPKKGSQEGRKKVSSKEEVRHLLVKFVA